MVTLNNRLLGQVERQLGIKLSDANVLMEDPFTSIGEYEVPLKFPKGVVLPGGKEEVRLRVKIRRK